MRTLKSTNNVTMPFQSSGPIEPIKYIKNHFIENLQYYAKYSFENGVLNDAKDLGKLMKELIPIHST